MLLAALSISANAADRLIRVKVDDKVSEGTEIAIGKGIFHAPFVRRVLVV